MTKLQGSDESTLLWSSILFPLDGRLPYPPDTFAVEEFGLSAREVLSPDMLIKPIVDQTGDWQGSTRTTVKAFLCYNWKRRLPFAVVMHQVDGKQRHYTPQYGHEDNYPTRHWSITKYQICSLEELPAQCPEVAAVLKELE
jgi:hypothetical protein